MNKELVDTVEFKLKLASKEDDGVPTEDKNKKGGKKKAKLTD